MNRPHTESERAEKLLQDALAATEGGTTREWALSEHNAPIFREMALRAIRDGNDDHNVFATRILCLQIGL